MKYDKRFKILEYLREGNNITMACRRAGIAPKTFYRWCNADKKGFGFEATMAIDIGEVTLAENVESALIKTAIKDGNPHAQRFFLSRRHHQYLDHRRERNEITRSWQVDVGRKDVEKLKEKVIPLIVAYVHDSKKEESLKKAFVLLQKNDVDPIFFVKNLSENTDDMKEVLTMKKDDYGIDLFRSIVINLKLKEYISYMSVQTKVDKEQMREFKEITEDIKRCLDEKKDKHKEG